MAITDRFVNDFKERMRIGDYEDDNLKRILEASEQDLLSKCGEFDIESHHGFRELVYDLALGFTPLTTTTTAPATTTTTTGV